MKNLQFWVLLFGACIIAILELSQIALQKSVFVQQRTLVDNQEVITTGPAYLNSWQQLAVHMNRTQDPELATVLKNEKVRISTTPPPAAAPGSKTPSPNLLPGPRPAGQ